MTAVGQTALVVRVPEAEPLVGLFRLMHDPVASRGMPAHVTILYPFRTPDAVDESVRSTLRRFFASRARFECVLPRTDTFPGVLYLTPEPDEPFRALTRGVVRVFPDTPPYGGAISDPDPHLTVAHADDADELDAIATRFADASRNRLPVRVVVADVWLMEARDGVWWPREPYSLGSSEGAPDAADDPKVP